MNKVLCECGDNQCPIHVGDELCSNEFHVRLFRSDMDDQTGILFCEGCAADAMESGVFYEQDLDIEDDGDPS